MNTKKEFEKACFEQFWTLEFGSIPDYKQLDPPHPDISLELEKSIIGIEFTTIYKDNIPGKKESHFKRNESLHDSICSFVENKITRIIELPVEIHIGYNEYDISGRDVIPIGRRIIEIITPKLMDIENKSISKFEFNNEEDLPNSIYRISGIYLPNFSNTFVSGMITSFAQKLSSNRILETVMNKEEKMSKYISLYDYYWLVLCIQTDKLSSDFSLADFKKPSIQSLFHRVYLLQYRSRSLFRLK